MQKQHDVRDEQQENCDIQRDLVAEFLLCHLLHNHISLTHLGIHSLVVLVDVVNNVALTSQICICVLHNHVGVDGVFFNVFDLVILAVLGVEIRKILITGVLLHLVLQSLHKLPTNGLLSQSCRKQVLP